MRWNERVKAAIANRKFLACILYIPCLYICQKIVTKRKRRMYANEKFQTKIVYSVTKMWFHFFNCKLSSAKSVSFFWEKVKMKNYQPQFFNNLTNKDGLSTLRRYYGACHVQCNLDLVTFLVSAKTVTKSNDFM